MIQDLIENVKLTPQEQNIVNYIDHHPKEVMTLNAKELSEKIFVSPPTMNRFIKKLGFSGYFDFQLSGPGSAGIGPVCVRLAERV